MTYDEIKDIEFRFIRSEDNKLLGWMWFAVIKFVINIPKENKMRSIRLRKENIQIGNETTLSKFFKEARGSTYFIGEVMAIDKNLIPNAGWNTSFLCYKIRALSNEMIKRASGTTFLEISGKQ